MMSTGDGAHSSTFSLRGLISQRRPRDVGHHEMQGYDHQQPYSESTFCNFQSFDSIDPRSDRALSWLPTPPLLPVVDKFNNFERPSSSQSTMTLRTEDIHDFTTPMPPPPKPLFSQSPSSKQNLSRKQPPMRGPAVSGKPASNAKNYRGPKARPSLLEIGEAAPPARPASASNTSRRTSLDGPAHSEASRNGLKVPARPAGPVRTNSNPGTEEEVKRMSVRLSKDWSSDIKKLIQETDQAFSSSGGGFSQFEFDSPNMPLSRTNTVGERPPPIPERNVKRRPAPINTSRNKELPPPPPEDSESAALPVRHNPTKPLDRPVYNPKPLEKPTKQKKVKKQSSSSHQRQQKASIWSIPENVTDIFKPQRFKRIEADEMLTPDRLAALKKKRQEEAARKAAQSPQPRHSNESTDKDNSRTSAESSSSARSQISKSSSNRDGSPNSSVNQDGPAESSAEDGHGDGEGAGVRLEDMISPKDTRFGSPPAANQQKSITFARKPIGDASGSSRESSQSPDGRDPSKRKRKPLTRRTSRADSLEPEENDEYVFLKSTPYTLTKPSFKHGPIAFSKAEIGKGVRTMDETLDWSAFQMAILGGAGEFIPRQNEDGGEEKKVTDDLAAWWDSFGFEGCGELVPEGPPSPRGSTMSTASYTSSVTSEVSEGFSSNSEVDLPLNVDDKKEGYFGSINHPADNLNLGQTKFGSIGGSEAEHGMEVADPLVVGGHGKGSIDESDADHVQMSCNMTADLGEFLRWEAQHMAGGF